jgi:spore germination protein GerM
VEQAEAEPTEPTLEPETEGESAEDPAATPILRRRVEVYFPSAADEGLIGEFREIFNTANPGDRAKQIIADLISGPETDSALRALPPTTRLRQVYVLDNGIAYLDFSSDLREGLGGGSMEEILAVYAIVNSVVININEVHRVGILVNGRTVATLNGHLDLRRPLPPDYSLILESVIVRAPVQRSRPQTPAA